jgi:hypothetical protein
MVRFYLISLLTSAREYMKGVSYLNRRSTSPDYLKSYVLYRSISISSNLRDTQIDPFARLKSNILENSLLFAEDLSIAALKLVTEDGNDSHVQCLKTAFQVSLWASSSTTKGMPFQRKSSNSITRQLPEVEDNIIDDQLDEMIEKVLSGNCGEVTIVTGKVGTELLADMFLGIYLLRLQYFYDFYI